MWGKLLSLFFLEVMEEFVEVLGGQGSCMFALLAILSAAPISLTETAEICSPFHRWKRSWAGVPNESHVVRGSGALGDKLESFDRCGASVGL